MIRIIQTLLCTVLTIQFSRADIPYKDVKLQIFDTKPRTFEKAISESLETTKNFWADETVEQVIGTGSAIVHFLPFGEAITTIVGAVTDLLKEESEWKAIFVKALAKEQDKAIISNQIEWFTSKMNTIEKTIPLLDKDKESDNHTRITYAFSIHQDIYTMLDYYHSRLGLFRKYPLVTAPLLINLALLITIFTPLSNDLIPSAAKQLPIACYGHDILKLYRSLTVYTRLEKTNMKYLRYMEMMTAMASIDKYGIGSKTLSCDKGCKKRTTYCESEDGVSGICSPPKLVAEACKETCIGLGFNDHSHCIKDEYGSEEFDSAFSPYCVYDYTALIRSRVEEFFPLKYLNELCERSTHDETGSGWVTILIGVVSAYGLAGGNWCDVPKNDACDPFVRIYINDELVDETSKMDNTYVYDADHQFISGKIKKSSKIKIEVLDDDGNDNPEMILQTEGTIDDFIKNPYRSGGELSSAIIRERSSINTYVLWEDE